VIYLMEALRRSVEQAAGKKEKKAPASKGQGRPAKAAAGSSRKR